MPGAIFVLPGFMQQGIGMKVLNYLECLARDLGLEEVNLDAMLNAADFYRRCGYMGFTIHLPGFSWLVFLW